MSRRRQQKKNSQYEYEPHLSSEVLKYCPNYSEFDKRARYESEERINQHLRERRGGIKNCVHKAEKELTNLGLSRRKDAPHFIDDDEIINNAAKQTNIQINKWDGVQIKQCKKADANGEIILIDTFQKFVKKAKNHQDQTSWKISGDYFFAPYIKKVRQFLALLCEYCSFTMDCQAMRREVRDLLCLSFANALFSEEIKFHRTKPKPLMRHRTLVKSQGIHTELQQLHKILTVGKFIQCAKAARKTKEQKSNIIAADFFIKWKRYTNQKYLQQKRKVCTLLNLPFNGNDLILADDIHFGDFDELKHVDIDGEDHMQSDEDEDDIDLLSNISSSSNTPPSLDVHCTRKRKKRQFQATRTNTHSFRDSKGRETKANYRKRVQRQHRIRKKANCARKHCQTQHKSMNNNNEFDMESIGDVSAINALVSEEYNYNNQFCSDCTNTNTMHAADDRTTISTISMSPTFAPYGPDNGNVGAMVRPMLRKAVDIRRENDALREEIQHLKFIINQRRTHYNMQMHALPPPLYPHQPPPIAPPHHVYYDRPLAVPSPQMHVQTAPIQVMQPPLPPLPTPSISPPIAMDTLLPVIDDTVVNDDGFSCQFEFIHDMSQSVDPLIFTPYENNSQSVCMQNRYNQSPETTFNFDSAFN